MYQIGASEAGSALAMTGALTTSYYVIGAWTLLVAGLALVMTTRVLRRRRAQKGKENA